MVDIRSWNSLESMLFWSRLCFNLSHSICKLLYSKIEFLSEFSSSVNSWNLFCSSIINSLISFILILKNIVLSSCLLLRMSLTLWICNFSVTWFEYSLSILVKYWLISFERSLFFSFNSVHLVFKFFILFMFSINSFSFFFNSFLFLL